MICIRLFCILVLCTVSVIVLLINYPLASEHLYRVHLRAKTQTDTTSVSISRRINNNLTTSSMRKKQRTDEEDVTTKQSSRPSGEVKHALRRKQITVYRPFQGRFIGQIRRLNMKSCLANNCVVNIVYNETTKPINADAVVFQGNRVPRIRPKRRSTDQLFVFANTEPPGYVHYMDAVQLMRVNPEFYNWTMTYKSDSDVWMPYAHIIPRDIQKQNYLKPLQRGKPQENLVYSTKWTGIIGKDYNRVFDTKSKNTLWFVSHCVTPSKREKYVERMTKKMKIDIFGNCGKYKIKGNDTFNMQYKFYLAFENSLCEDYITEKMYSWFSKDIIVVTYGGADYSKFVPDGTYINAADFPNPEALADFLNKLGSDRERYIGYLKRKDQYQVITEQESAQNAFCGLCWRLNNLNERQYTKNMSKWWLQSCQTTPSL